MTITQKPGWVYFLREVDYQTGEKSAFVKIGMTAEDRPVAARIAEHQTGNPRQIIEHCSIETPFVNALETHLHHRFSETRLHGEWFRLDGNQLRGVINEAMRINEEMEDLLPKVKRAEEFSRRPSDQPPQGATDQAKKLHQEYISAETQHTRLKLEHRLIEIRLRRSTADSVGIRGITVQGMRSPAPRLDVGALAKAEPTVYEAFLSRREELGGRFTINGKPTGSRTHPELYRTVSTERERLPDVDLLREDSKRRSESAKRLHAEWLCIQANLATTGWITDRLEIELKSVCGVAEAVEGICTWRREYDIKESFDRTGFKRSHPELWTRFSTTGAARTYFSVLNYTSY